MKLLTPILLVAVLTLSACSSTPETEEPAKQPKAQPAATSDPSGSQTAEAGCGSCIFKMPGVKGCKLAVKVEGKAYLVKGANIKAHKAGLCSGSKQAKLEGKVEGDAFVVTSFELLPVGKPSAKTWTCSMHPSIKASKAGECPTCGMDLIPSKTGK